VAVETGNIRPKPTLRKLSYSDARANLAKVWDRVVQNNEPAVLERRGSEDVVLIAASEFRGLVESAHLLRSPKNARRLMEALNRALADEGDPSSVDQLAEELGLEQTE
jgi:antitoxin YefM